MKVLLVATFVALLTTGCIRTREIVVQVTATPTMEAPLESVLEFLPSPTLEVTLTATLTPLPTATATPERAECTLNDISKASRSVARVETAYSTGSGFLINSRTLVTAQHVVADSSLVFVDFADGFSDIGGISESPFLDLAVVKLRTGRPGFGLQWRDSRTIQAGEEVVALGYPLRTTGQPTLTRGTLSRFVKLEDGVTYLQTDAALNFGNSGGPLLDECGRVVAVMTLKASIAEGISLGIVEEFARPEIALLQLLPTATPGAVAMVPTSSPTSTPPRPPLVTNPTATPWPRTFDRNSVYFGEGCGSNCLQVCVNYAQPGDLLRVSYTHGRDTRVQYIGEARVTSRTTYSPLLTTNCGEFSPFPSNLADSLIVELWNAGQKIGEVIVPR